MEPITITVADAKKATGLGVTTIYDLINRGKLETVKIGRRTLIKTKSIRELLGEAA